MFVTQEVWNSNFFNDLVDYIEPSFSKDELNRILLHVKSKSPTTYEKLETLIDRFEFVGHLDLVKQQVKHEDFIFRGKEIVGIDWDIDALRLYLALTCIDILASNFEPFDKWLLNNCQDFDSSKNFRSYINEKSKQYRHSFQLSSNFSRAFLNSSKPLRKNISKNVAVKKGGHSENNIESIVSYFYRIRNKYTHEGRRFHSSTISLTRKQIIGPRDKEVLEIKPNFDLVETILLIAKEQANRTIMEYAEQLNSADAKNRAAD